MTDTTKASMASDLPPTPGRRLESGIARTSVLVARLLVIALGAAGLIWMLGWAWSIVLPVLLGFLLATVLWTPTRFLGRFMPVALAATIVVFGGFALLIAVIVLLVPIVGSEVGELVDQGAAGLGSLRDLLSGAPFNIGDDQIGEWLDTAVTYLQDNMSSIASSAGVVLGSVGSMLVTGILALVLTFYLVKDGARFPKWMRGWLGEPAGTHADSILRRVFDELGKFLWSQAAVSLVDAVLIGVGLWALGVPLVIPLALVTFIGGFIPIIGAFATGALAVLVALVSGGAWDALWVLVIVILVQQLEGNVLSPILVGKAMTLHPAVVLGVITLGGSTLGITGAFLAVPVTATIAIVFRYIREQLARTPSDLLLPGAGPTAAVAPPA